MQPMVVPSGTGREEAGGPVIPAATANEVGAKRSAAQLQFVSARKSKEITVPTDLVGI